MPPVQTGTRPGRPTRSSDTMPRSAARSAPAQPRGRTPATRSGARRRRAARLLGAEGHQHHRHRVPPPRRQPGQLEHHGHAARVVLGARRLRHGVEVGADEQVRPCPGRSPAAARRRSWCGRRAPARPRRRPSAPEGLLRHVVAELGEPVLNRGGRRPGRRRTSPPADRAQRGGAPVAIAASGSNTASVVSGVVVARSGVEAGGALVVEALARVVPCVVGSRRAVGRTAGDRGRQDEAPVRRRVGSPHHVARGS